MSNKRVKACFTCGETKPLEDFYRSTRTKDGRGPYCKDCAKARTARRYAADKERHKAYSREYYRKHRDERRPKERAYRRARVEERAAYDRRHYRKHKEEYYVRGRRYRKTERGKRTITRAAHKRRALLLQAETDLTEEGMLELLATYEVCPYCGTEFEGDVTWDHIVPLSRGGSNKLENLLPVCSQCNSDKGTKLLDEWTGRWYQRKE